MGRPWLSVIMPVYNGASFLTAALDGLVAQGDGDIEVIAIDDGSTDGSVSLLRSFSDRLDLRIFEQPRGGNWVASTNRGLDLAGGAHISLLHQDDHWLPGRLSVLRPLLTGTSRPTLLAHSCWFVDPRGRRIGRWRCPLPAGRHLPSRFVLERLLVQNFFPLPGVTFSRRAALEAGGMDDRLWFTADWDLWLKLAASGSTWYLDEPLAAYRIHPGQLTMTGTRKPGEIRRQLEAAVGPHLERWRPIVPEAESIERVARFSIRVNETLAARSHGQPAHVVALLASALKLGPRGIRRYLRDSRIHERVGARLRVRSLLRHNPNERGRNQP
jgi:hypothetical protein